MSQDPRHLMCGEDQAVLTARLHGPAESTIIGHWPNDDEDGFRDAIWSELTLSYRFDVFPKDDRDDVMSNVGIEVSQPVAITIAELGTQLYELSRRIKRLERKIERMENP